MITSLVTWPLEKVNHSLLTAVAGWAIAAIKLLLLYR